MDLNIIEKQLNKDCLDNIYSFIKPSKEKETLINFYEFIQEEKIKWFCNKLETLKVGFYYIDKSVLENTYPVYFKVIKITKCFITISKFLYNYRKKEFENINNWNSLNFRLKIKKIEDTYELKSKNLNVKFIDLIEYDKPPEFIKYINYKTTSPHMFDKSLTEMCYKINFDYKKTTYDYSKGRLYYKNSYLYYDFLPKDLKFKENEEFNWIFN